MILLRPVGRLARQYLVSFIPGVVLIGSLPMSISSTVGGS
jgi:hypothetical protein